MIKSNLYKNTHVIGFWEAEDYIESIYESYSTMGDIFPIKYQSYSTMGDVVPYKKMSSILQRNKLCAKKGST